MRNKISRKSQSTKNKANGIHTQEVNAGNEVSQVAPTSDLSETLTRTVSLPTLTLQDFASPVRSEKFNHLKSAVTAARAEAVAIKARGMIRFRQPQSSSRNSKFVNPNQ